MRGQPNRARWSLRRHKLVGSLLALFAVARLQAAESTADAPHFSLSPHDLYAAASAPRPPEGADVSVLEFQESHAFDADGNDRYTQYFVYKILSQAGAEGWWSTLATYWAPWRDDKPEIRARVIAPDGTSYALDPATIADSAAQAADLTLYSDERLLRAPLPAIAPGAVIESEIVLRHRPSFAGAGMVARSYLQLSEPIEHFRLTLEATNSITLRHRVDAAPGLMPKHTTMDGVDRWVFDSGPTTASDESVLGLPGDVYVSPMVTFSTGESWSRLALEYSKIVAERLEGANLTDLVTRLTKGRVGREAKAEALVEYLNREIRYTGIEFDQSSVVPHKPAETLARKYGDCKDKSLLLVAMLRAAGVPADLVLLNAGNRIDTMSDLPGMSLFDHAIVYAPGEPALWIDATAERARLGQLPDQDRGRWALIIDPDTTSLTKVDEARSTDNVLEEDREIRLADRGAAQVVEISRPQGSFEVDYRGFYANLKDKSTIDNLTDYLKGEYLIERLEKTEQSDPKDFSQSYRLTLVGAQSNRANTSLRDAVVYIRVEGMFDHLPFDLRTREPTDEERAKATRPSKKRIYDYQLNRPFVVARHYRIVPPAGFQPAALPEDSTRALGPARYSEHFSAEPGGVVRVDLRFDTAQRRFTAEQQTALRNEVAALSNREAVRIKFDLKAHVLLTEGKAANSFQAYRDLVAQHPKDSIQHLRRADGLMEAGMGEAARAETTTAIRLDPKSAFAQQTLATVLQYDLIGRWHQPGADYAGAAAAYRAAIDLDAHDDSLVANYAVLLEHDSQGVRYAADADLGAAIAEYRKLTSRQRANLGIPQNLAYALFYARDFSGALEAANSLETPPLPLIVACEAQLGGVTQAIDEAKRRTNGTTAFNSTLAGAGQMLLRLREYANAAALLEIGASGANMAQTMGLVTLLRQAKRHEDVGLTNGPEDLVRRVMSASMQDVSMPDSGAEWLGRNARLEWQRFTPRERDMDRETRRQAATALATSAARAGFSKDAMVDLMMQGVQVRSTGDDTVGYRMVVQSSFGAGQALFVVKEDGQYKILADPRLPVPLGMEVLDRLQHDDLAGASTLLRWLRESMPSESSDDALGGNPFFRFWTPGQRDASANEVRLAAASLLVQARHSAQQGLAILQQGRGAASNDAQAQAIQLAMLSGYEQLRDHEHALEIANELALVAPQSKRVFSAQVVQLRALKRFADADKLALGRLELLSDDIDALRALAVNAGTQGDYAAAYARYLKVLESPSSVVGDSNSLAWLSLFFERPGGPDVDSALRATQIQRVNVGPALHTLGCVYAEMGKTREAREVLLQSMDARAIVEPNSEYWYAFGRIAEQYGEREIALADYAKVTPSPDPVREWDSTYRLAQQRIAVLGRHGAAR
jgi:tetratricopeptide (TPR) repeat protein